MEKIRNNLELKSSSLLFNIVQPNEDLVMEALTFDASIIASISNELLSSYIVAIGQYIVMLQYQENRKNVECMAFSRALEFEITKKKIEGSIKAKSVKDFKVVAIMEDEKLFDLNKQLIEAEAEQLLMANMVNAVSEFLNALKKEKSGRTNEQRNI
jgi:hypothetical protein